MALILIHYFNSTNNKLKKLIQKYILIIASFYMNTLYSKLFMKDI